jgi:hypothetical protein
MLSCVRRLTARLPRSRNPRARATQKCRARLQVESLEAREVPSGVSHTAADSAADYYENLAVQTGNVAPNLMKGYEALLAQDHPVDGFYRLEYYFANYAHDYSMALVCYEWAIYNASYWAVYNPSVPGSGSDRHYGIWNGMFEADAYYDPRFDGPAAQAYRDYAHSMADAWNTTPIGSTIAGWWHIGTGNGYVYISPISATKVTMYLFEGSTYMGEVSLDLTSGNQSYGIFYHAYNTSLTNALSFTFDDADSAHMYGKYTNGGTSVDLVWTRWYA